MRECSGKPELHMLGGQDVQLGFPRLPVTQWKSRSNRFRGVFGLEGRTPGKENQHLYISIPILFRDDELDTSDL